MRSKDQLIAVDPERVINARTKFLDNPSILHEATNVSLIEKSVDHQIQFFFFSSGDNEHLEKMCDKICPLVIMYIIYIIFLWTGVVCRLSDRLFAWLMKIWQKIWWFLQVVNFNFLLQMQHDKTCSWLSSAFRPHIPLESLALSSVYVVALWGYS